MFSSTVRFQVTKIWGRGRTPPALRPGRMGLGWKVGARSMDVEQGFSISAAHFTRHERVRKCTPDEGSTISIPYCLKRVVPQLTNEVGSR
jgi:hypothetical protein